MSEERESIFLVKVKRTVIEEAEIIAESLEEAKELGEGGHYASPLNSEMGDSYEVLNVTKIEEDEE
jgi:hypothetical protein